MLHCKTASSELKVPDSPLVALIAFNTILLPTASARLSAEVKGVTIAENIFGKEEDHQIVYGEEEPSVFLNELALSHPEEEEVRLA